MIQDNSPYIQVEGCITGYIAPRGDQAIAQAIDAGDLPEYPVLYY